MWKRIWLCCLTVFLLAGSVPAGVFAAGSGGAYGGSKMPAVEDETSAGEADGLKEGSGEDLTVPSVRVELSDIPSGIAEGNAYYNRELRARITITDPAELFDEEAADGGIRIRAYDWNGDGIYLKTGEMISEWTHEGDVHRAEITFTEDARYVWSVSYTNAAGKTGEGTADDPYAFAFTLDRQSPRGAVLIGENRWDRLLTALTFGIYRSRAVTVTAEAEDEAGPVTILYYMTDREKPVTAAELEEQDFQEFQPFTVDRDERFVVYLRIVDAAGNRTYVSSDGHIVDMTAPEIRLAPDTEGTDGIYREDVNVTVFAAENASGSGIRRVEYWLETVDENAPSHESGEDMPEGTASQESGEEVSEGAPSHEPGEDMPEGTILYEAGGDVVSLDELSMDWSGQISFSAEAYNGYRYLLWVKCTDRAGNESRESLPLDFDTHAPEITVSFDGSVPVRIVGERGYFGGTRTAEIVITERTDHFDPDAAAEAVKKGIRAADAGGKEISLDKDVMLSAWKTTEGDAPDAARHRAGIVFREDGNYTFDFRYTDRAGNESGKISCRDAVPTFFTVDQTAPSGYLQARGLDGREKTWKDFQKTGSSEFSSRSGIFLSAGGADAVAPLETIRYIRTDGQESWSPERLEAETGWREFHDFSVMEEGTFRVCLKITDYCGNTSYITSDRLTVEKLEAAEPEEPEESQKSEETKNPENTEETGESAVSDLSADRSAPRILVRPVCPDAGIFREDAEIKVKVQDLPEEDSGSGLDRVWYEVYSLGKLTERGDLYAADSEYSEDADLAGSKSRKVSADGTEVPPADCWSGTILADSEKNNSNDVRVCVYAKDLAGNTSQGTAFLRIDMTEPSVEVEYDNNQPQNGHFYKSGRVAVITVTERNFSAEKVQMDITGTGGKLPEISDWQKIPGTGNGDDTKHVATVSYREDGDYTFAIRCQDAAGNLCAGEQYRAGTASPRAFTIDTGAESPVVSGVEQGVSYMENAAFRIRFSDANYEGSSVRLLRTRKDEQNVDVTGEFIREEKVQGAYARIVRAVFPKSRENDGIYTLTASLWDRAGNRKEETVTFTLNRFGSVYLLNDALLKLKDQYVRRVEEDLVITEYNPDLLLEGSLNVEITRNAAPLPDVDYTVRPAVRSDAAPGKSGWYQYDYVIRRSNFTGDGVYSISVSSKDRAGNRPETENFKDCRMTFYVDSTAPEISNISGLEEPAVSGEYRDVSFEIYDTMGIQSVTLFINGKETFVEDISSRRTVFSGSVRMKEGRGQTFRLLATDYAGNVTDTDAPEFRPAFPFYRKVTISASPAKRIYARGQAVIEAGVDTVAGIVADAAVSVKEDPGSGLGAVLLAVAAAGAAVLVVLRKILYYNEREKQN